MEAASIPEGDPSNTAVNDSEATVYTPGLSAEDYQAALATEIEALATEDDDGNTHVIKRYGEAIGAATAYVITAQTGSGREVHALEVEAIDTDPANYNPVFLAFIAHAIATDPQLTAINGPEDNTMTRAALDLTPHLPRGWYCEYTLPAKSVELGVTTPNPQDMLDRLESGGKANFAFKKLYAV